MKDKVYKFAHYTKTKGLRRAVGVAKQSLKGGRPRFGYKGLEVMVDVRDVMEADFINSPYKKPDSINKDKLEIAWVLSPISSGSGGQNTITRFIRHLQNNGHKIVIYIYEGIHPQRASDAKKILLESFNTDVDVRNLSDFESPDALIATGWETAYPVFNMQTKAHKFYFVQDFEPYFYGLGSKFILAENTYKFGFYGITAGKWLSSRLAKEYKMNCDYFDFGVDLNIYKPNNGFNKSKKICFYARPVTERRAFELGVIALDIFHKKHPEYEIDFFGWDVSEYKIPFPYTNHGILSHDELASLYQESVACLVLSLTNVSLLPLELLAAGCMPVMNNGDNNKLVLGENDHILYTGTSPIELAAGLDKVVSSRGINKLAQEASSSVEDRSWSSSYARVEKILLREVTGR